tara:strand:- start:213 stop:962 length:750 start_codon:yes stop_codon:yes gene_type:complete
MKIRSVVSIPKEEDYPEANEDNFRSREDGIACALSDGASESFDSKAWSIILCENFNSIVKRKKRGKFFHDGTITQFLNQAKNSFNNKYQKKTLSWSQEASFRRGSFATILGVIDHGSALELFSVGDTVAIWQKNGQLKMLSMHVDYDFNKKPILLSTLCNTNNMQLLNLDRDWSIAKIKKKEIQNNEIFLLTDALAKRVIDIAKYDALGKAINIMKQNHGRLKKWIIDERSAGLLKKDDYTIVWIESND